ncbi:hypothetical protein [Motilibacter peucedani]|uniref:hypothetical protein n=1 Tax=Motilibacter peucedani TaxID=598650 RepID=UPI000EB11264|nr:hypothetical protein [Motilibacter peucedani]
MTSLAWLAIPVVAVVLAIACVSWLGRTRRPADVADTVESYARFQAALSQATSRSTVRVKGPDAS